MMKPCMNFVLLSLFAQKQQTVAEDLISQI